MLVRALAFLDASDHRGRNSIPPVPLQFYCNLHQNKHKPQHYKYYGPYIRPDTGEMEPPACISQNTKPGQPNARQSKRRVFRRIGFREGFGMLSVSGDDFGYGLRTWITPSEVSNREG